MGERQKKKPTHAWGGHTERHLVESRVLLAVRNVLLTKTIYHKIDKRLNKRWTDFEKVLWKITSIYPIYGTGYRRGIANAIEDISKCVLPLEDTIPLVHISNTCMTQKRQTLICLLKRLRYQLSQESPALSANYNYNEHITYKMEKVTATIYFTVGKWILYIMSYCPDIIQWIHSKYHSILRQSCSLCSYKHLDNH